MCSGTLSSMALIMYPKYCHAATTRAARRRLSTSTAGTWDRSSTRRFATSLENNLKTLAANDVEQGERRAFGLLGSALQLRDVARSEVEIAGKRGLA